MEERLIGSIRFESFDLSSSKELEEDEDEDYETEDDDDEDDGDFAALMGKGKEASSEQPSAGVLARRAFLKRRKTVAELNVRRRWSASSSSLEEEEALVPPLWQLCVEEVTDQFGLHSRQLLNVSLPARDLLLAHLKARFLPPRSGHRRVGAASGLSEGLLDWFILPDVRSLDLSSCCSLSSRTMNAIASRCFQLTALDLSHATSIKDADLRPLFPPSFPFATSSVSSPSTSLFSSLASPLASTTSSPSSSGSLAFSPNVSTSSSLTQVHPSTPGNSYSFASSSSPAPASPARSSSNASASSPGFWSRLFSRSSSSPAPPSPAASSSLPSTPPASRVSSGSNLAKDAPSLPIIGDDGSAIFCLRSLNLRNCSGLTGVSVENILRLWGTTLRSLTLDGDRINPASIAALASATQLTRLALLHSPYLKPIPVSEMKNADKAEESKHPVFEWQLAPALQSCLTQAMTELILHFDSDTITEELVCQVVGQCGSGLKLLEMPLPSPEAWKLVLRHCTSLRKLELFSTYCNDEAISGIGQFPSVTEIIVRGCSLSDESFGRIASACPKATKIELRSIETVSDAGMETIAKTVAGNLRDLVIASLQQVTDAAVEHFISHCSNVRTLQLAGMSSEEASSRLTPQIRLSFPSLVELRLSSLHLADHTMTSILGFCTQLRTLHMDDVAGVTGSGIKSTSLKHLHLRALPQLTAEGIAMFGKQCPALRSVRVKHQPKSLPSVLTLLDAGRLLELRVGEANLLNDEVFANGSLYQSCHLEDENRECFAEVDQKTGEDPKRYEATDELTSKQAEDNGSSLSSEDQIVGEEATAAPEEESHAGNENGDHSFPPEQTSDQEPATSEAKQFQPSEQTDSLVALVDAQAEQVPNVPLSTSTLRYIKLKNCPRVTDKGVGSLMQRCPWMTQLRLYYFPQVTGSGLGGPNLRSVVLDQCGINDEGFIEFIKASPKLREIEINGAGGTRVEITKLTDDGLRELHRYCSRLRSLSLSFLSYITLSEMAIHQLESLTIEDLPAVTEESLSSFITSNPRISRLDVRAGSLRLADKRSSVKPGTPGATVMNVSATFVESLKSSRPNLAVTYRLTD